MDYGFNRGGGGGGLVAMYDDNSRNRGNDYGDGFDGNTRNRRDFRQGRSDSPNGRRRNSSRGRDRSRSPRQFQDRVYDDFAARDFSNYNNNNNNNIRSNNDRNDGYDRNPVRDYREAYNNRDNNNRDERDRRPGQRFRDSRDERSESKDRFSSKNRDRDNRDGRDDRDYRENRDGRRDYRDSRDRDRDRDGSRDYRDRSNRDGRDKYDRDDDDRSRRRSRDNDYRDNDNFRDDNTPPSSTIILQNIGPNCTELKIEDHVKSHNLPYRNVAVIRDRSGENKGYAFVEFGEIELAEKWLRLTKRSITIDGQHVQLNFSKSRKNDPNNIPDWNCFKCNILNFGSRKRHDQKPSCYKCGAIQIEPENRNQDNPDLNASSNGMQDGPKVEPCNVLMIRGMDFSTTEEMIRSAIGALTTRPIFDVRLIRDKFTDMSRGFAFIEMGSVPDATGLLDTIENSDPPFEISKRRITIGYARHGYNAPLNGKKVIKPGIVSKQMQADNAVAQASSANANSEYSQSVADTYQSSALQNQRVADATAVALSTANAGVAAANMNAASGIPSSYTYDPTSGYYYDSSTSLYYDPNTGYYYNSTSGKWLYWNGSRYQAVNQDGTPIVSTAAVAAAAAQPVVQQTAVQQPAFQMAAASTPTPVPAIASPPVAGVTAQVSTAEEAKKLLEEKEKVAVTFQKPKTARKIAKDMERWAKKMNTATEARKIAVKQAQEELKLLAQKEEELRQQILQDVKIPASMIPEVPVAPKDNIRSLFVPDNDEEGSVLKLGSALNAQSSARPRATASVIAADIPDDDDYIDESKFVDQTKLACLLCKRQFPSKDVLTKHLQMSQLHKDNLEKYKQQRR